LLFESPLPNSGLGHLLLKFIDHTQLDTNTHTHTQSR